MVSIKAWAYAILVSTTAAATQSYQYTWNNAQIVGGGFIPSVVFSQAQKDLIYLRTDIGGVYRWNTTTSRWNSLSQWVGSDNWNLLGSDALAADPNDASRVYVAAGMYTNSWDTNNGAILSSTNQGNTWTVNPLPFKVGGNDPGRGTGERLAVDPNLGSTLFFGARSGHGLWKSTNYGATWANVTSLPNTGPYAFDPVYFTDPIGLTFVTFDKSSGTSGSATPIIFVGVADNTTSNIYVTKNGGTTWSAVPGQPINGFFPHKGRLSSDGYLYISYSNGVGPYDGTNGTIAKYNTATGAWTDINPYPSPYFGYGGLAIDATNPQTIMTVSLNSWWPDAIIFRSTNGGANWTQIWDWTSYPSRSYRYSIDDSASPWLTDPSAVAPEPTIKLGWMIEALEIDPFNSNRIFWGTGATLWGSSNLKNWDSGSTINITVQANGIEETSVLDLLSPPTGTANLYSAVGDIGGFVHTDLTKCPTAAYSSPTFTSTTGMDYAENSPAFMARVGTPSPYIAFTYSSGSSWYAASSVPGAVTGGGMIAAAADASSVVWSPTGDVVYYSTTTGSSWIAASGIPSGSRVASDRVNGKKYYGYSGSTVYISTNGGATFTKTAATGLPSLAAGTDKAIKAVPGIEGDVWIAGGTGGLFHSVNNGTSFTNLTVVTSAVSVGFGKAAPGLSYPAVYIVGKVSGVNGFFRSDDAGVTWVRINDDLHQYGTANQALTGDPRIYGRVYIGTNGLGAVYGDIVGTVTNSTGTTTTTTVSKTSTTPISSTLSQTTTTTTATTTTVSKTTTSKTTTTTTTSATSTSTASCIAKYGQCGGSNWTGATCCVSGSTCIAQNPFYSQCL
ncbi:unnamed protein product [Umbelopsis ramanniana]